MAEAVEKPKRSKNGKWLSWLETLPPHLTDTSLMKPQIQSLLYSQNYYLMHMLNTSSHCLGGRAIGQW